jgi:hypothetical protein
MASILSRFLGTSVAAAAALRVFPFSWGPDPVAKAKQEAELAELHARKVKANAMAAEAPNMAKAEVDKAKAEVHKIEAETDKAKEEKVEAANRAEKIKAEKLEAAARAAKENDSKWALRATGGVFVLGVLFLMYDYYTHSHRPYLRARIRKALLRGPVDDSLPEVPPVYLPLPRLPIDGMKVPLVVMGASGSGKSTQLGVLARELKQKGVPVVYFRLRDTRAEDGDKPAEGKTSSPARDLSIAAQKFYAAMDYPQRAFILSRWKINGIEVSGKSVRFPASPEHEATRFIDAIGNLYYVCNELYMERKMDPKVAVADRAPFVLADELHDLLNDRTHNVGGQDVFRYFGNTMVSSSVDDVRSRTILAGSGASLLWELGNRSVASGDRVTHRMQPDPPESAVRQRLLSVGYDSEDVDKIVATCGTRVRLLGQFLDAKVNDFPERLHEILQTAQGQIEVLMARCPEKAERTQLVQLLDELASSPSSTVRLARFPKAVQNPFPKKVLLEDPTKSVSFQTEAIRKTWIRIRGTFA